MVGTGSGGEFGNGAKRVRIGHVDVDKVTFREALDRIDALVARRRGGMVFTPNVDHIVQAEENPRFRAAYAAADLSLADGMPVLWASHLLRDALPQKVSGSDLVMPLMERAAEKGWRVFFLGGAEGVARRAADILVARLPALRIVGCVSPRIDVDDPARHAEVVETIRAAEPDLVLVALGAPKQELFSQSVVGALAPAVLLGVGGSLDFIAGVQSRAPGWMSSIGMEWFYRLAKDPRRLWRRYLVRDPKFFLIVVRDLVRPRREAP